MNSEHRPHSRSLDREQRIRKATQPAYCCRSRPYGLTLPLQLADLRLSRSVACSLDSGCPAKPSRIPTGRSCNGCQMTRLNRACTHFGNVSKAHPRFRCSCPFFLMAGALVYEAWDVHDPKPFLIDPEFLLMMLSSVLIFCVGIATLIRGLYSLCLSLAELLRIGTFGASLSSAFQHDSFEIERLFSPPLRVTSLRI